MTSTKRIVARCWWVAIRSAVRDPGCSRNGRSSNSALPLSRATKTTTTEPRDASRASQRVAHRHDGRSASAHAASAASGTSPTAAWTTSGCNGMPPISMPDKLTRRSRVTGVDLRVSTADGTTLRAMPVNYTDDLRLAHVLADDADSLSADRFQSLDLRVETKPDLTPVTDADQAVEVSIRRTLGKARTRDAVLGEEQGSSGASQRRWVIDPIDGTKNFVRGVPVWATLIALMVEDEVVVGVVSAPQLNRRWWAMKDGGAFTGRSLFKATACRVSDVSRLEDASLSYSSLTGWDQRGRLEDFLALVRRCW